jgi:hypothetical protein
VASLDKLVHQDEEAVEHLCSMSWRRNVGLESVDGAEGSAIVI